MISDTDSQGGAQVGLRWTLCTNGFLMGRFNLLHTKVHLLLETPHSINVCQFLISLRAGTMEWLPGKPHNVISSTCTDVALSAETKMQLFMCWMKMKKSMEDSS